MYAKPYSKKKKNSTALCLIKRCVLQYKRGVDCKYLFDSGGRGLAVV